MPTAPIIMQNLPPKIFLTPSPVAIPISIPVPGIMWNQFVTPDPVAIPILIPAPGIKWNQFFTPDPVSIVLMFPDPEVAFEYFGADFEAMDDGRIFYPLAHSRSVVLGASSRKITARGQARIVYAVKQKRTLVVRKH